MNTQMDSTAQDRGQEKMSKLRTMLARQGQAVVAAPAPAPVAPPAETAVSAPAKAKSKAQFEDWIKAGEQAALSVGTARAPELALRPALSEVKAPAEIVFTIGTASNVLAPVENEFTTLADLAALMTERGRKVGPKDKQGLITAGTFSDGNRRDESTTSASLFLIDADGAGDLAGLRKLLTEEGIAHIFAWSSSCDPTKGAHKYHVAIPLSAPIAISDGAGHEKVQAEFKHPYAFALGALGKIAGLPAPLDAAMASPCQPFYLAERKTEDAPPREVYVQGGRTLDLLTFVNALGFEKVVAEQDQVRVARRSETRAAIEGLTVDGDENKRVIAARCDLAKDPDFWGVGKAEGGRHNAIFYAATRLGVGFDLNESVVENLLRDLAATMDPPPDEGEIVNGVNESRAHATEAHPFGWKYARHVKYCAKCRAAQNPTSAPAPAQAPAQTSAPAQAKVAKAGTKVPCPTCGAGTIVNDLGLCMFCDAKVGVREQTESEPAGEVETAVSDGREVIAVNDRTDAMAEGVVQALSDTTKTPNLFQRAGSLVEILNQPRRDRSGDTVYTPALRDLPDPLRLAHLVAPIAAFKTAKKLVAPPPAVMKMVMLMGTWPGIRPIEALISCPIVRRDGQVRTEAGYDAATHSYLIKDVTTDPIGETAEDATAALAKLLGLLADFPFRDRARGQSVWLSALLTRLTRGQYGTAPMFLARGNAPNTGKGTLVDLICLIADGERPSPMAYTDNDVELAKALHSDLRAGADVIVLDNVPERFPVESAVLAIALTADKLKSRVLNVSENEAPSNQATWFMTGNGTALSREIARRTLNMDLFTDRPAGAQVQYTIKNINNHVRERRGEYLAAVLTVYRAWVRAGRPVQDVPTLSSFDDWSDRVRQCVLWAATLPGMSLHLSDPVQASDVTGTDEVCAHGRLCLLVSDVLEQRKVAGLSAADMLADLSGAGPSGAVKALTEFMRGTEERFPGNPSFWAGKILGMYDVSKKGRVLCADGCERWLCRDNKGRWKVGRKGDALVKTETPAQRMTTTGQVLAAVPGPF